MATPKRLYGGRPNPNFLTPIYTTGTTEVLSTNHGTLTNLSANNTVAKQLNVDKPVRVTDLAAIAYGTASNVTWELAILDGNGNRMTTTGAQLTAGPLVPGTAYNVSVLPVNLFPDKDYWLTLWIGVSASMALNTATTPAGPPHTHVGTTVTLTMGSGGRVPPQAGWLNNIPPLSATWYDYTYEPVVNIGLTELVATSPIGQVAPTQDTTVNQIFFCNTAANGLEREAEISLCLKYYGAPWGGEADYRKSAVIWKYPLAPNDTLIIEPELVLAPGDQLVAVSSFPPIVDMSVYGTVN